MTRSRYPFVAAGLLALGIAAAAPVLRWQAVDGLLDDTGTLVRHALGLGHTSTASVAVLAVDADSLAERDLRGTPRLLFGPVWADLTTSLVRAGAKAVVFDFIFAVSVDDWMRRQKVGQGGIDGGFLEAIQASPGRVVLARTGALVPALPYRVALDADAHPTRMGLAELVAENDGVVRDVPAAFPGADGQAVLSLHRSALVTAGLETPAAPAAPVRMRVDGPLESAIPTVSLGAWRRCVASRPDGGDLARQVAGRVVFVGSALAEEDRRAAGDRLILRAMPATLRRAPPAGEPCALVPTVPTAPATGTVPAVYLHAAATAAHVEGRQLVAAGGLATAAVAGVAALAAGGMAAAWSIPAAVAGLAALAALLVEAAILAPLRLVHLPVSPALLGLVVTAVSVLALRFLVVERRERLIRTAFGRYLSPRLVADLAAQETLPVLGGETRRITVLFSDLAGFTRRAENLTPAEAIALANRCLSCVVDSVDAHGGYVDKFIGDAVMALWNAPASQDDHAGRALDAALAALARLRAAETGSPDPVGMRLGLETGDAAVGNIGTEGRLSYTAIGDTVNVAARLEALCKVYGVPILVGPGLALALGGEGLLALDDVVLAGRSAPTRIHVPVACVGAEAARAFAAADALAARGDARAAAHAFAHLAATEPTLGTAAAVRAARAAG